MPTIIIEFAAESIRSHAVSTPDIRWWCAVVMRSPAAAGAAPSQQIIVETRVDYHADAASHEQPPRDIDLHGAGS
jgi:hypothetical protein